jgi:hypothetical protein
MKYVLQLKRITATVPVEPLENCVITPSQQIKVTKC